MTDHKDTLERIEKLLASTEEHLRKDGLEHIADEVEEARLRILTAIDEMED